MSDRGTNNAPNTRHPDRPPRKPGRLEQFGDDLQETVNPGVLGDVTSHDEAAAQRDYYGGP
ncbi:hypothetical protein [Effusibacillus lacus]|uniref:Uncharacterized protein n=1 Tax=Effusibacillus lacus TaxID=1348429 RepID=A0A292YJM9_9BACL|nr:hypothetical protein [Effusibacillus lacus]TCS75161.1 hypothetical protein EDD64_10990 [Effusibacillus lacus]GAX89109.1 hypothetical protein EFBL_0727 [Effusibacillus lacus]